MKVQQNEKEAIHYPPIASEKVENKNDAQQLDNYSTSTCSVSSPNIEIKTKSIEDILFSINLALLEIISKGIAKKNYKQLLKEQKKSIFNSKIIPTISLINYMKRLLFYCKLEIPTLIAAIILADKFCKKSKIFLSNFNVHKIILTSIVISIKSNEDLYYTNKYYAKIGGVSLESFNKMEYEFLINIRFESFIDKSIYQSYAQNILYS